MINLPPGTDLEHLRRVHELGLELMEQHGLEGWTLKFDGARNRGGYCLASKRIISISARLTAIWTIPQVTDLLLHEIAHALTPNDPGHGHQWKAVARRIGADPTAMWGHLGEKTLPPRYIGTCPNGHTFTREKMTASARRGRSCGKCSPKFDRRYLINWERNPEA